MARRKSARPLYPKGTDLIISHYPFAIGTRPVTDNAVIVDINLITYGRSLPQPINEFLYVVEITGDSPFRLSRKLLTEKELQRRFVSYSTQGKAA